MAEIRLPDGTVIYNVPDYAVPQKNPGQPRTGMGVGAEAMLNAPQSALQYGKDTLQAVAHPIETAKTVGSLFTDPTSRAAVADFFKQRYGGWENIKNTVATDPVGFAADLSVPMSAGGTLAARLPGLAGQVGRAVQTAGKMADPLTAAGYAAQGIGKVAGEVAATGAGVTTGAGRTPIKEAVRVGFSGSPDEQIAFLENLRGTADRTAVLRDAKVGLKTIRDERRSAYDRQMGLLKSKDVQLDFAPVLDEWNTLQQSFLASGGVSRIGPATQDVLRKISGVMEEWARTPAAHNVDGLDALKQRIRDEAGNFSSLSDQQQRVVTVLTQKIGKEIEKQAPEYAQIMKAYETESRLIDDIEQSLSLGTKQATDTAIRKLQSVMRNNVNTNYGRRADLLGAVEEKSGRPIMPALAGQSLNAVEPRGWGQAIAGGSIAGGFANPMIWSELLAASPRVVGTVAYRGGQTARAISDLAKTIGGANAGRVTGQAAFQSGRYAGEEKQRKLAAALGGGLR